MTIIGIVLWYCIDTYSIRCLQHANIFQYMLIVFPHIFPNCRESKVSPVHIIVPTQ